jgi:hypothetical protein
MILGNMRARALKRAPQRRLGLPTLTQCCPTQPRGAQLFLNLTVGTAYGSPRAHTFSCRSLGEPVWPSILLREHVTRACETVQ